MNCAGCGLLPETVIRKLGLCIAHIILLQTSLIDRVPVVSVVGTTVFVIVHVRCCPELIKPVASTKVDDGWLQSPEKEVVKPDLGDSTTVKGPGSNTTD